MTVSVFLQLQTLFCGFGTDGGPPVMWDTSTGTSSSHISWVRFRPCKSFSAFILLFINTTFRGPSPQPLSSATFHGQESIMGNGRGCPSCRVLPRSVRNAHILAALFF